MQLPEGVNCALDFLELFRKRSGMDAGRHVSFGKINMKNVRKLKPDGYEYDGDWDWEKGFHLFIFKSDANSGLTADLNAASSP